MRVCIFDCDRITQYELPTKVDEYFLIKYSPLNSDEEYTITVAAQDNNWYLKSNGNVNVLAGSTMVDSEMLEEHSSHSLKFSNYDGIITLYALPSIDNETYKIEIKNVNGILIGNGNKCHIVYNKPSIKEQHCLIKFENNAWILYSIDNASVYLNNNLVKMSPLKAGDVIFIDGLIIIWMIKFIKINNPRKLITVRGLKPYEELDVSDISNRTPVSEEDSSVDLYNDSDYFYHTPRLKNVLTVNKIKIDSPPGSQEQEELPLILTLGSSLTMGATSLMTGYTLFSNVVSGKTTIIDSLPSIITCAAMLIGSLIMPRMISSYQKSKMKKREKLRQNKYKKYLGEKDEEVTLSLKNQMAILNENNPNAKDCVAIINNKREELWSREITDDDFLNIRLGKGKMPAYINLEAPDKHFTLDEDNLFEMVYKLKDKSKMLNDVPVIISLSNMKVLSFWCNCSYKEDYLNNLLLQLVTLQSAVDLKIVILTDKKKQKYWDYAKLLPHIWSDDKTFRFFATNLEEAKEVSEYLEQEYKSRKEKIAKTDASEENIKVEQDTYRNYPPYYVILTDNYKLIKNVPIINILLNSDKNFGFSLVAIGETMKDLPNKCLDFIQLGEIESGILKKDLSAESQQHFKNEFEPNIDMKKLSVSLSNIPIVTKAAMSTLPSMISFLDMYGVSKIEQLNIQNRWKMNNPVVSLGVPIGVHEDGEQFKLDLHEKFHGPHGLIAGSTGSGKSEFIITYILSLACNFHPYEVQFVLIDYKGGGLAGAFENKETGVKIPHLAGTITNLDTAEMNRTLVSIQSELKRRQRKFNEVKDQLGESTIDIYKYQKFYREGLIKEPMAHLFIISDEFAELKSQQPEFLSELVSAARIGRSLGVHLILATQKPSGVVNDQIWSNSKFKVCLKVQDRSDSMEVLKRPEAASIKETGRFYLQVGYDDYFDVGQSAWGGAKYVPTDVIRKKVDDSLVFVNNVGYAIKSINEIGKKEVTKDIGDQLTNIVRYIYNFSQKENIVQSKLWLDAIPAVIYLDNLKQKYNYVPTPYFINPVIGEYDNPKAQEQGLLNLKISQANTLIYGESGSGKENLLTTLIYSSIVEHTPEEINFYIIDCGAETLRAFYKMPHVGGVVTVDEGEKISCIFQMIEEELEIRKDLFADYVGNYQNYIENSGKKLPIIEVVINNYEIFCETYPKFPDMISTMYRDGVKYGISFIVSCTTINSVRGRIAQYFSNRIALRLPDASYYRDVVDAPRGLVPAKYFGRGLVSKDDTAYEFQTAYIYDPKSINKLIQTVSLQLNNYYTVRAKKIKTMPEQVTLDLVIGNVTDISSIPIGYELNSKDAFNYNFSKNFINVVSAENITEDNGFINSLIKEFSLVKGVNLTVIDFYNAFSTDAPINIINKDYISVFANINNDIIKQPATSDVVNLYMIIGVGRMIQSLGELGSQLCSNIFTNGSKLNNYKFVFVDSYGSIKNLQLEDWYQQLEHNDSGIWIGPGIGSQMLIRVNSLSYDDKKLDFVDMAFAVNDGNYSIIKHVVDNVEVLDEK